MALYSKHTETGHTWGIWKIEEDYPDLLQRLDHKEAYLPFLEKSTNDKRKTEWLAVRVLLKELAGEEWLIKYHPDGAPFLSDSFRFISISHTKGYVAVSLKEQSPTGIDIEHRSERIHKIRSRFLSPEEDSFIEKEHETDMLLVCWCAKETAFKLIRQEEVDFQEHLHITPFPWQQRGIIEIRETRSSFNHHFDLQYEITSDFTLTYY